MPTVNNTFIATKIRSWNCTLLITLYYSVLQLHYQELYTKINSTYIYWLCEVTSVIHYTVF